MASAPKLLDRVRAEVRLQHYSRRTEEAYVHWIRRYIVFHGKQHPRDLSAMGVTAFLTWLAVEKGVAASTQNQAFSALLFLYKDVLKQDLGVVEHAVHPKPPIRVPVVLSIDEVRRVLKELNGVSWLIASLLFGAGLRLQECLELPVKDVDFDRREIVVRRGKGQKDRRVMLRTWSVIAYESISTSFVASTRRIWRRASDASCCRLPWSANFRTRRRSGAGSLCFRRAGSAVISATGRRRAFTCTRRWSSALSQRPLAARV